MENDDTKITRQEWIHITMLVLTTIFIVLLIFALVVLIRSVDEIKTNPIDYGIKNSNIEYCTCYNAEGQIAEFGEKALNFEIT